jgi:FKBP-type peptidyl-prolyl cis-trans isomerase (trigger factor)
MESKLPIDLKDITIDKSELDHGRIRLLTTLSGRLAKRFKKKMVKAGQDASGNNARNALVQFCLAEAYRRFEITPLLEPVPSPNSSMPVISEKSSFVFSVDFDPTPDIDFPDFATLEICMPEEEVTDDLIDTELETQGYIQGERSILSSGLEDGGELTCSVSITIDGDPSPFFEIKEAKLICRMDLAHCFIHPFEFPDLNKKLIGLSAGEEKSIDIVLPSGVMEGMDGKKATLQIRVISVSKIKLASPDQVADVFGSISVDQLKQQIRFALEDRIQLNQQQIMRDQVFNALNKKIELFVPESVTKEMLKHLQRSKIAQLKDRGYEIDEIKKRLIAEEKEDIELARVRAKFRLIFLGLSVHLDIMIEEEDVTEHIDREAAKLGKRPAEYREEIVMRQLNL